MPWYKLPFVLGFTAGGAICALFVLLISMVAVAQ